MNFPFMEEIMEDLEYCITTMSRALMMKKDALQPELAVALFVFTSHGTVDIQSKKTLRGVYAAAGVDCLKHDSPYYTSVMRYTERAAMLFESIGKVKLRRAIRAKSGSDAIEAIITLIAPLDLTSWDDVVRKTTGREPQKRTRVPGAIHIKTDHCRLDLTPDATLDELMTLREKLDELIAEREAKTNGKRKGRAKAAAPLH
jgi:hypothetical protein